LPFTLAHPVAAVPLARKPFVMSALVVGAVAPDFEYALRLAPVSTVSHTLVGLLVFCVPTGLLVLWLWHALLKQALVEMLPDSHYRRPAPLCTPFHFFPLPRFLLVLLSIFIGSCTHVAWDSFTHSSGWLVQRFSLLSVPLIDTQYATLRLYKILQHSSTLLGTLALACLYLRRFRRCQGRSGNASPSLTAPVRAGILVSMLLGAALVALAAAWASKPPWAGFRSPCTFVVTTGVVGMGVVAVEAAAFSCWWHFFRQA
jgi:hypothetical protein